MLTQKTRRKAVWGTGRILGLALLAVALVGPFTALAQPPPRTAAQDGFVPVDESAVQEHLPAAPLVMAAYGIAWGVILVYVWSLWKRLGKVEHDIVEVSRRLQPGTRQ
jgi:CcmD family protein